jgi:hypothetical protein
LIGHGERSVRNWQAVAIGLAAVLFGSAGATGPVAATARSTPPAPRVADPHLAAPHLAAAGQPAATGTSTTEPAGSAAADRPAAACSAFPGARQLAGGDGVSPAAWSGGGLVVPACGPVPGDSERGPAVYPYPGSLWTAGYQCVEFSERYLYDRYGVTMDVVTNGDQVAAHYATNFPGLFTVISNGTPKRPPAPGDVLSLSTAAGFDSPSGGHTAVVQASAVNAAGNGTVTIVEENAATAGVARLAVTGWTVRYPGYPYLEWLTTTGQHAPA